MSYYVGILDGSGSAWGVRVPDLPGVHGGGSTPEDAIADTASAAREWAGHRLANNHPVPAPRRVDAIMHDKAVAYRPAKGESIVMIPLVLDRGRAVKANVSLDAGQLEAIDAEAKRRGLTRSAFLTSAALEKIERN